LRVADGPQPKLTRLTRRPAVWAALCLIAGILVHSIAADSPRLWLTFAAIGAASALVSMRWTAASTIALASSIIFTGIAIAQLEHYHFPASDISAYITADSHLAEIELIIDDPPRVLTQTSPAGRPLPPRQVGRGIVQRIKTKTGWQSACGDVQLQINPPLSELAYGQRITALGMLSQPAPATNPGDFVAHLLLL
jgi:hypothetical protein